MKTQDKIKALQSLKREIEEKGVDHYLVKEMVRFVRTHSAEGGLHVYVREDNPSTFLTVEGYADEVISNSEDFIFYEIFGGGNPFCGRKEIANYLVDAIDEAIDDVRYLNSITV